MSLRSMLAGPSRSALRVTPTTTHIRHITIPHPDTLVPAGSSNQFLIRTMDRIPNIVVAFAILRAIEAELGVKVISIDVNRNSDNLKPNSVMRIRTLRAVELPSALFRVIPRPKWSGDMNGGPSLAEVQEALNKPAIVHAPDGRDIAEGDVQFKIEIDDRPFRPGGTPRTRGDVWNVRKARERAERHEQELDILEEMGGEFKEIAEKWSWLRRSDPDYRGPPALRSDRQRSRTPRNSSAPAAPGEDDETERLENQTITEIIRGAKHERHSKNRKQSEHEEEALEGEEGVIEHRRRKEHDHSLAKQAIEELRRKKQLEKEAEREEEVEEVTRWNFVPGSPVTAPTPLDATPTAQNATPPPRPFSLRALRPAPPDIPVPKADVPKEEPLPGAKVTEAKKAKKVEVKQKEQKPEASKTKPAEKKPKQEEKEEKKKETRRQPKGDATTQRTVKATGRSDKPKSSGGKMSNESVKNATPPKSKAEAGTKSESPAPPSRTAENEKAADEGKADEGQGEDKGEDKKKGFLGGLFGFSR